MTSLLWFHFPLSKINIVPLVLRPYMFWPCRPPASSPAPPIPSPGYSPTGCFSVHQTYLMVSSPGPLSCSSLCLRLFPQSFWRLVPPQTVGLTFSSVSTVSPSQTCKCHSQTNYQIILLLSWLAIITTWYCLNWLACLCLSPECKFYEDKIFVYHEYYS